MTATLEQPAKEIEIQPHRFSSLEYHAMHEAGVFRHQQRMELIRGEIYFMAAMGAAHYRAIRVLNRILSHHYSSLAYIVPQAPIKTWDNSEPEPDFALLKLESRDDPPFAKDVLLVIEVSDATVKFDRSVKLAEYARSSIAEYWILNLKDRQLEVYRQPDGERYLNIQIVKPDAVFAPLFALEVTVKWFTALEALPNG